MVVGHRSSHWTELQAAGRSLQRNIMSPLITRVFWKTRTKLEQLLLEPKWRTDSIHPIPFWCACELWYDIVSYTEAPHITPSCPVPKIWTAPQWRDDDGSFFPQYKAGSVGSMADQRGAALKAAILLNSPNVATHRPMPPFDIAVAMLKLLCGELTVSFPP